MPETLAAVAAEVAFEVTGDLVLYANVATYGAAVIQTAMVVGTYAYNASVQRKRAAALAAAFSREANLVTVRSSAAARPLIVGRTRVGAPTIAYAGVGGDRNQYIHLVLPIAAHEVDAIEDIYFDDVKLGMLDGSSTSSGGGGNVVDGKFAKALYEEAGHALTWPAVGSTVALPTGTKELVVVAPRDVAVPILMPDGSESTVFREGVHYEVVIDSSGISPVPVALRNLAAEHVGRTVIVTTRGQSTRSLVRVKKYLGIAAGERDTDLEADSDGRWTSAHVGKGVPRIHVRLEYDQEVFGGSGMPNITMIVRGAKCYNWTDGSSSWTHNTARIITWFLMRPEGFQAKVADFDATLALAAQHVCDESVPIHGGLYQDRYPCNGVINPEQHPMEILSALQGAMAGEVVPCGHTWDLHAGAYQSPAFTITDEMIVGNNKLAPRRSRDKKFNSVRGRFANPEILHNDDDVPPYASATYIAQDGGTKLWSEIDLPYTTDVEAAQRLLRIALHKERNPATWTVTCNMRAYPARAGMNVYSTASAFGWQTLNSGAGKVWHVVERSLRMDGLIDLVLVETAPQIFDWTYDEALLPDPTPDTGWPDWTYVEPVSGLRCVTDATTYLVDGDGNVVPYARLMWTPPASALYTNAVVVARWRKAAETSYREERAAPGNGEVILRGVARGDVIVFHVWVEMPSGARSDVVFGKHTAAAALPTQGVPASSIETGGNDLQSSDLAFGVGFIAPYVAGLSDPAGVTQSTEADQRVPGTPTNGLLYQHGTQTTGYVDGQWPPVAVIPGERRGVEVLFHPIRCRSYARIEWRKNDGSPSSHREDFGNFVEDPGIPGLADLTAYSPSTWIGTVPADATNAVIHVYKSATTSGSDSVSGFAKPQFRRLGADVTTMPLYASGPTGSVGTTQLEPASATSLISGSVATSAIADGGALACTASSAYTAVRACQVVVSSSVTLDLQANAITGTPSKYAYGLRIQMSLDGGATWSFISASGGGVEPSSTAGGHILDLPATYRRGVSLAIPAFLVSLASGDSALFRAYLSLDRGVQAISQSAFSITVQVVKA